MQGAGRGRLVDPDVQVARSAEFGDGRVGVRERLAVQSLAVLDIGDALALEGAGEDDGGLPGGGAGLPVGTVHGVHIVSVDLDGVPAEGLEAAGVGVQVVAVPGRAALAQPVHVHDGRQVVQILVRRVLGRLPHGALGEFAVPAQHPHPVAGAVQPLPGERDADADRQSLSERAARGLHPRHPARGGVPFETAADPAEGEQLAVLDGADGLVGRVQQRRGVPLGQDEPVVARVGGPLEVVAQMPREENGHQIGG